MNNAKYDRTKGEICGGSLLHPQEIRQRYHQSCFEEWKSKNYVR